MKNKCGTKTIDYPDNCSYVCSCNANPPGGCTWAVTCGENVFSGTSLTASDPGSPQPPRRPHVTIDGSLDLCAKLLEQIWNRPVIVPAGVKGMVKRKLSGTPEQIAKKLGLELGPQRKGRSKLFPGSGETVSFFASGFPK